MDNANDKIHKLIDKALSAEKSDDALKFSQSALNAAHALQVMEQVKGDK